MQNTANSVTYDLDCLGAYCTGTLTYHDATVTAEDSRGKTDFPLGDCEELVIRSNIGCGALEYKPKGAEDDNDNLLICRFSMTCIDDIGEFVKVINHFIVTGEETVMSASASRICPKCGRHFMHNMDSCFFCTDKSHFYMRVLKVARPYRKIILAATLLIMLADAVNALVPVLNGRVLDDYLYAGKTGAAAIQGVLTLCAAMLGAKLFSQIFQILARRSVAVYSTGLSHTLRVMVYDKIQRISMRSLHRKTGGDLMGRVTDDTEAVKDFISEDILMALYHISMFAVIVVILCIISVPLTLLVLLPVPIGLFIYYKFRTTIHIRFMKQWRCERWGNSVLRDIVEGIRVVKLFGAEKREIGKFDGISKQLADICTSNERLWASVFPFVTFFIGIGEFLVLFFGGRMAIRGEITAGQLLQFTLYLAYLYGPINWFSRLPQKLGRVNTSLIKIFEILDEKSDMDSEGALTNPTLQKAMEFKDVRFGYTAYEPVLKDVNLTVKKGEMIGIVGRSGVGKSTLINLIMRLYDVDAGSISIDGCDIRSYAPEEYRQKIAVVFQQTFLFAGSVYDNIAYARPDATTAEVIEAAKVANAHEFIMKLPDGYNTLIGENAHNLSGGEKQRISIARAVLRDPEILILDEATSALDTETEYLIQQAMSRLVKGRTTFAIAHRLSTLKDADRLIVLDKGVVAECGTHVELVRRGGIYAGLVAAQHQTARLKN